MRHLDRRQASKVNCPLSLSFLLKILIKKPTKNVIFFSEPSIGSWAVWIPENTDYWHFKHGSSAIVRCTFFPSCCQEHAVVLFGHEWACHLWGWQWCREEVNEWSHPSHLPSTAHRRLRCIWRACSSPWLLCCIYQHRFNEVITGWDPTWHRNITPLAFLSFLQDRIRWPTRLVLPHVVGAINETTELNNSLSVLSLKGEVLFCD